MIRRLSRRAGLPTPTRSRRKGTRRREGASTDETEKRKGPGPVHHW